MTITTRHQKIFWVSVAILATVYYAPSIITGLVPKRQAIAKPSPFLYTPRPVPPAEPPVNIPFRRFTGIYNGRALISGRGVCFERFELRLNPVKLGFAGYSTLTCVPQFVRRPNIAVVTAPTPVSIILVGQADESAIRFAVEDAVDAGRCAPTSFVLKPFGMNGILIEFQDCRGKAAMTLGKVSR
jgi:hypothetical protein